MAWGTMFISIPDETQYRELFTTIYVMAAAENPKLLLTKKEFSRLIEKRKPSGYPAIFLIDDQREGCPTLADIAIISEADLKALLLS